MYLSEYRFICKMKNISQFSDIMKNVSVYFLNQRNFRNRFNFAIKLCPNFVKLINHDIDHKETFRFLLHSDITYFN